MFKRNVLVASLALAGLCSASAAMADIVGGGASLPAPLYQTSGVLTAGFAQYISVGSGGGKAAFLNNDATQFKLAAGTNVHWAGSDSKLSTTELTNYANNHQAAWGPLIQVPSVATSVALPFIKAGGNLNLSTADVCGIFSGQTTDWGTIAGSGRTGAIKVLYRAESSGTSELLTRFLNAQCSGAQKAAITSTFASAYPSLPTSFVAVSGTSEQVMNALNAETSAITYMSPDWAAPTLDGLSDATKVAQVNGVSPAPANVSAAIASVQLPTDVTKPNLWVPVFGDPNAGTPTNPIDPATVAYPTTGYPILGFTNLIFSQCYADANQTAQVRTFFGKHYGISSATNNDNAITANRFVPLPAAWKTAIRNNFVTASSNLSIGNTNVCNAIGRPL